MKRNTFLLILFLAACSGRQNDKNPIQNGGEEMEGNELYFHLRGMLGNKIESSIELSGSEQQLTGYFDNHENGERISIAGTIEGKVLRLEEYNNEDESEVTGIFEGVFDTVKVSYEGFWHDPATNAKVPFHYTDSEAFLNKIKDTTQRSSAERRAIEKIKDCTSNG